MHVTMTEWQQVVFWSRGEC